MAQVDSRIALGFQPATQIESPVNNLARILQVQGAQQANQLNAMKLSEAQAAGERRNKLSALLSGQYETPEAREDALLRGGFLEESQQARKSRIDARTAEVGAREKEFKVATDRLSLIYNAAAGAKDQASYDLALRGLQAAGIDVSGIPPQYDPAYVESAKTQALTEVQRLEQMWKNKDFGFKERQQTETERNNQTQNRISQGQLGVAQANVGLRRKELELNQSAPRGQFIQTDQGYVLADPRTGQVQPVLGPDGKPVQGKAATKNLTEGQAKANLFGSRMLEADRILNELEGKYSPLAVNAKVAAAEVPLVGGLAGWAGNAMLGDSGQQAEQAQRDFINAVLRRESGAVISEPEFKNAAKQYFPQQGDSKAVLDQKRRNRQLAIQGMAAEIPGGFRSAPTLTNPGAAETPAQGGFKILSVE